MSGDLEQALRILVIVTPNFNLTTTAGFIDPSRAANYLEGKQRFRWSVASADGGEIAASNGMPIITSPLSDFALTRVDLVVVSSSWAPEVHRPPLLLGALRRWARAGVTLGGRDTGAFILADAGLLKGRTCHFRQAVNAPVWQGQPLAPLPTHGVEDRVRRCKVGCGHCHDRMALTVLAACRQVPVGSKSLLHAFLHKWAALAGQVAPVGPRLQDAVANGDLAAQDYRCRPSLHL